MKKVLFSRVREKPTHTVTHRGRERETERGEEVGLGEVKKEHFQSSTKRWDALFRD